LGYFSHGNDDEWIFGYVVLAITPDGFRWRPPPTLLADVEAGLSELMGDLKQDTVKLFLDVDWRNVHLGDCVEVPLERGDLPGIDWTVTPPHTPAMAIVASKTLYTFSREPGGSHTGSIKRV